MWHYPKYGKLCSDGKYRGGLRQQGNSATKIRSEKGKEMNNSNSNKTCTIKRNGIVITQNWLDKMR